MVLGILFHAGSAIAGEWGKDIKRIVLPFGMSADQLPDAKSKGAALYASYCSQCHNLPSPKMHSASDWPMRFEKMMDHAIQMAGSSPNIKTPAKKDKKEIVSYLQKNGFRALPANSPLLREPQAFNLLWFCSVCHAVPDPDQFPADVWSTIVDRMNSYRKIQGREEMNGNDREMLIHILVKKRP
jgi:hypothetical protein